MSSSTGAISLHGPHHSAQKSTMTAASLEPTDSSKVASERVMIPSAMVVLPYQDPSSKWWGTSWPVRVGQCGLGQCGSVHDSVWAERLEVALGFEGGHAS